MTENDPAAQLRAAAFRLRAPVLLDMDPEIRFPLADLLQAEAERQELFAVKGMGLPDCRLALAVARAVLGASE